MAYKRGEEVFRDPKPFIYFVDPKYRKVVCDWGLKMCENEGILKACIKCKWVHYCDQTCQKEAWNSHHKLECKYLQKQSMTENLKEIFSGDCGDYWQDHFLKLLKTTLKLNNNGTEEVFQLPNGKKRRFADLVSNSEERRKQLEQKNMFGNILSMYEEFRIWLEDIMLPSFIEFFEIFGKWQTNAISMMAMDFDKPCINIAGGLYLGYSSLDHSCVPNALWFNIGKAVVVRIIEDVENFSAIRVSYFEACEKTHERREYLRENYFFNCTCLKCENPDSDAKFSSLKCKSCPGWVHEITRICIGCNQSLKLNDEELTLVEKYKKGTLPKCDPTMTTKEIRSMLEKYMKIFHVFHEIYRSFEKVLSFPKIVSQKRSGNHDALLLVLEIRKLKLNHYSGHLPRFHHDIVTYAFHTSYAYVALKLFDEAEFHMKKAEEVMKITYGEDHPYMQEHQKQKMKFQFARIALK